MTVAFIDSATPGFRDGDRHGALDRICTLTEKVLLGQTAAALLADELPLSGALVVLPSWSWVEAGACVGRKGKTRDGKGTLLLPARTTYDTDQIVLLAEGEERLLTWAYTGVGRSGAGTLHLSAVFHTVEDLADRGHAGDLPERAEVSVLPRRMLKRKLEALVEDGKSAAWERLLLLERYVERAVLTAHDQVVAEVNNIALDTQSVRIKLDTNELDEITTRMVYGEDGKELATSPLSKLLTKLAEPGTLNKVDPLMYLTVNLRRDAEASIRKRITDPHIGPKIRKVARSMPGASIEEITAEYNLRYPKDRAGAERISKALTVPDNASVHVDTDWATVESTSRAQCDDHSDTVIERIDLAREVARRNQRPVVAKTQLLPAPGPMRDRLGASA